jgi:transcriptional regulator with XRE-family HTH domain
MSINSRLCDFKDNLGLNQTQMADILGVDQSTYSKYEKDGNKIPRYAIIILKLKYHINEEWLRKGNGRMIEPPGYETPDTINPIEEPLVNFEMNNEIEELRKLVSELMATVRDQATTLKENSVAERDNARSRFNLTETVVTQARAIENLSLGEKASKKGQVGALE